MLVKLGAFFFLKEPFLRTTHLEFTWHDEFRGFHSHQNIDSTEDEYGQDDGKVADELPDLGKGEGTRRWLLVRVQPNRAPSCCGRLAHSRGEERAGLELLQTHGAGVGAKEQDEGHEGDVWDKLAGLPHQLAFVLQALRLGEGRPRGVRWLQRQPRD